jgi:hypothetical protein
MNQDAMMAAVMLRKYGSIIDDDERDQIYSSVGDLKDLAIALYDLGPPFNPREVEVFSVLAGNMDGDTNFSNDGDLWDEAILNKYATHVYNHMYQYNNEAKKVDQNIDTEKVHVGPMAQDLEKVNPATVVEDKSGYKTVDTGRLALMNAGAIADLARKMEKIENGTK